MEENKKEESKQKVMDNVDTLTTLIIEASVKSNFIALAKVLEKCNSFDEFKSVIFKFRDEIMSEENELSSKK